MRIYRREEFLKLPPGTFYLQASEPWAWGNLAVKYDTLPTNDWICQDLFNPEAHDSGELFGRLDEMLELGTSYPLETDCAGRDGAFDADALFMVLETEDLRRLRGLIDNALGEAK
jgi:hypothetical protein